MERETLVAIYQSIEPWRNVDGDPVPVDVRKRKLQKHALRSQGMRCEVFMTLDAFRATILAQYCAGICEDCRARHAVEDDGMTWVHPVTNHECKATALRSVHRQIQGGPKDAAANGMDQGAAMPSVPRAAPRGGHGT